MTNDFCPPPQHHESANWHGGFPQKTGAWCFAAAEQTVQAGFGTAVKQSAVAHDSLYAIGQTGFSPPEARHAVTYARRVERIVAENGLPNASWAQVKSFVKADRELYGYLRTSYGMPAFPGRIAVLGGLLSNEEITAALDEEGLVVKGSRLHYTVIYGYRRRDDVLEYHVYNPMNGGASTWIRDADVRRDMEMSFRVMG